jgi:peptidoglycan/LPS O-acetylase OafA/YrhL
MRSSSGQHFVALDHLRALAAFLVFAWHFLHFTNGTPVPFEGAPSLFPFALFDEGHTGVALFMVLSGYLFAKLLNGKEIYYRAFFWNRFIRLAPLLIIIFIMVGAKRMLNGEGFPEFLIYLCKGLIYPIWPNGGWSIATEIHFYLLLPFLLYLSRQSKMLPLAVVAAALSFRAYYLESHGEVQSLAYWTIVGRIDQFTIGIVAFLYASKLAKYKYSLISTFIVFSVFWWWFDKTGGFYFRPKYPSNSFLWVWIPTIEAVAYAALIVWYDSKKISGKSIASKIGQRLGEYSYSIYLFHFFIVFRIAEYINKNLIDISNFYLCMVFALITFIAMIVPGYLSFRFIESPFLRLRLNYLKSSGQKHNATKSTENKMMRL